MTQSPVLANQSPGGTKLVMVALLLAVLAVVLTNIYIAQVRRQVATSAFNVYVLQRTVRAGEPLQRKDVKQVAVPEQFKDSFEGLGAMDEQGLKVRVAEGEPLQRTANAGEVLTYAMFLPPGGEALDRNIATGKRQVSLPVNSKTTPGLLRPGVYVDIEAKFNTGAAVPAALPVMERVQVVSVGRRTVYETVEDAGRLPQRSFHTIDIEVTPAQATQLTMVQQLAVGEFELHVRNPADKATPKIPEGGINPAVLQLIEQRQRSRATLDDRRR